MVPSGYVKIAMENRGFLMKNGGSFRSYAKLPDGTSEIMSGNGKDHFSRKSNVQAKSDFTPSTHPRF